MNHSLYIHGDHVSSLYRTLTERLIDKDSIRKAYLRANKDRYRSIDDVTFRIIDEHIDFIRSQTTSIQFGFILFDIMSYLILEGGISADILNQVIDQFVNTTQGRPVRKLYV